MSSPRTFATLLLLGLCLAGAAPAQLFEPLGPPLPVSGSADDARWPSIAADASGNFVVVWYQPPEIVGQLSEILGRRYSATGDPLGDEFLIAEIDVFESAQRPRVAMQPDGRFVVVWGDVLRVQARAFVADGRPLGETLQVSPSPLCCDSVSGADVAALSDGRFVVAWILVIQPPITAPPFREIQAQRLDGNGQLVGEVIEIASGPDFDGPDTIPGLAADRSGGFLVTWGSDIDVLARYVGPDGQLLGEPVEVSLRRHQPPGPPVPTSDPDGGFSVVWGSGGDPSGFQSIFAQKLDPAGERVGNEIMIVRGPGAGLDVTTDRQGNHLAFWLAPAGSGLFTGTVQLYGPSWQSLSPQLQVGLFEPHSDAFSGLAAPAVAAGPAGFIAAWDSSGQIFARRFTAECQAGSQVLCLQDGRFRVEVAWRDTRNDTEGVGRALPLTSDSGALWFFHHANTELLVKVLDGRARNGHFWVFYGALSDVEYDLTVTDALTGDRKVYHNPAGTMASRADTRAFDGDSPVSPTTPSFRAEESARFEPLHPATGCLAEVCLRGIFNVEVEWRDPVTGELSRAEGAALTSDTAVFWFFGEENIELVVKVLDGRERNGHYWVFFGALTDLEYTITVGWGDTHQARTYHNPRGQMASRADTRAFREP